MSTKAVKLSDENYKWLCEVAGELQSKEKKMVSVDEALSRIKSQIKGRFSDVIGSWKMSDKEIETFKRDLKAGWKKWTESA